MVHVPGVLLRNPTCITLLEATGSPWVDELKAAGELLSAPFTNLVARPSVGNDHTGHVLDERLPGLLAAPILARADGNSSDTDGGGLYIYESATPSDASSNDGPIQAVIALSWANANGKIDGLAVNPQAAVHAGTAATTTASLVEQVCRVAADLLARSKGCRSIGYTGWIDEHLDAREGAPLAHLAGHPTRDQGAAVLVGLLAAGLKPTGGEAGAAPEAVGIEDIMYGMPLSHSLAHVADAGAMVAPAPVPAPSPPRPLHAAYSVVGTDVRSIAAGAAWVEWKDACFPEPGCDDPFFTVESMYTGRHDYADGELVRIAGGDDGGDGGDEPALAAAGTGVAHSFVLNLERGAAGSSSTSSGAAVKTCYLDWIGVLSSHRGKGLGRFVSASCLQHLAARGERYCTLWTQPSRKAAITLYESLGFVRLGVYITMALQLSSHDSHATTTARDAAGDDAAAASAAASAAAAAAAAAAAVPRTAEVALIRIKCALFGRIKSSAFAITVNTTDTIEATKGKFLQNPALATTLKISHQEKLGALVDSTSGDNAKGWCLLLGEATRLREELTLGACGIVDGDTLSLVEARKAPPVPPPTP